MSPTLQALGIDKMTVEERIALVQEIWDSVALEGAQIPLTEAQKQEFASRLTAYEANPRLAIPWEVVKAEALARLRK